MNVRNAVLGCREEIAIIKSSSCGADLSASPHEPSIRQHSSPWHGIRIGEYHIIERLTVCPSNRQPDAHAYTDRYIRTLAHQPEDWLLCPFGIQPLSYGSNTTEILGFPDVPELDSSKAWVPSKSSASIRGAIHPHTTTPSSLRHLTLELLGAALLPLAGDQGERHDAGDVHVRAEDLGVQAELLGSGLEVLKTLLVVGAGTADPDLDVVLVQQGGEFPKSADDTLERAGNVGEVGNATTDEEDLALLGDGGAKHEVQDGTGVVVGLRLGGSTGVLAVVGKLVGEASRGDGIGVDDGGTTTGNEGPDPAAGVQDSELEGGTSLGIELGNVSLLLGQLTAEGRGEVQRRASINVDLIAAGDVGQTQSGR